MTETLILFLRERVAIQRRKQAGEPRPWTTDPILRDGKFCNIEREQDRTARVVAEQWRDPHADDPYLIVAMAMSVRINHAPTITEMGWPLPWPDEAAEKLLARHARGEPCTNQRAYKVLGGAGHGGLIPAFVQHLFPALWNARDFLSPSAGESCLAVYRRLTTIHGWGEGNYGSFLAAQCIAATKFAGPLRNAPDFQTFVISGPGSRPGLNVALGRPAETQWRDEAQWRAAFDPLFASVIKPEAVRLGIDLSAQNGQNLLCEYAKYTKWTAAGKPGIRYIPFDETKAAKPRPRKQRPEASTTGDVQKTVVTSALPPVPQPRGPMARFAYLARRFIVPAPVRSSTGIRLVFDVEADGLLDAATKVHCIVVSDLDSDQVDEYGPDCIVDALEHLARADYLVGHNACGYDLPVLQRLHDWTPPSSCTVVDTLVAGRLILSNLGDIDDQVTAMGDPSMGSLRGSHSAEAWGVRLGLPKVGADITNYSVWTPELQARCVGDVAITKALWQFLKPDGYSTQALELEHRTSLICDRITAAGAPFDREAAVRLVETWEARRDVLAVQLQQQLPGTKLSSRLQIGRLLEAEGWVPEKRTEKTGQPVIDDELLESLSSIHPKFAGLAEYALLQRRIAQVAHGRQALLGHVTAEGRIHGGIISIGTPHSRAKHMHPNLAQIPNLKKGSAYAECRSLFRAPAGWSFVCADQANLQDRAFAHYLSQFDNGVYAHAFLSGVDQHWQAAIALGLIPAGTERDKASKVHTAIREGAKRFRYGFLFGAGNARAGRIIADIVRAVEQLDAACGLQQKFFGHAHPGEAALVRIGKQARDRFIAASPGLRQLRAYLEAQVSRYGWLPGLDGRRVPCRAQYTALNYAVTSAEAIICKRWLTRVYDELHERFDYGWDGDVVIILWIHDELVVCSKSAIAADVGEILMRHAKEAGEFFGLKVPLDATFSMGASWADEAVGKPESAVDSATVRVEKPESAIDFPVGADELPGRVEKPLYEHFCGPDSAPSPAAAADRKICCPFHTERTPSCHVYSDGHFHCFGCGRHGDHDELGEVVQASEIVSSPLSTALTPAEKTARAMRLWEQTLPIAGTLASRYLAETRGIDLAGLPEGIDGVLRFHPHCPFRSHTTHPCLVALMRNARTDAPTGIHRIALTPDAHKIERRMMGPAGMVKLWPAGSQLVLGEGIETALAAATRIPWRGSPLRPAWAALSDVPLARFPIIPGVERLIILVDHDDNGVGGRAADACAVRWQWARRTVVKLKPVRTETDFNDLIMPGTTP